MTLKDGGMQDARCRMQDMGCTMYDVGWMVEADGQWSENGTQDG